jgi:aminomethyltransferase
MGGKMVPFAGYHLPVQYEGLGVMKEHLHTRSEGGASLFDVSHMGQIRWRGRDAVKFIESVVVGDIAALREGEGKLSLITNEDGNIVDDTVITNAGDHIYMVVNGACKVPLCCTYRVLQCYRYTNSWISSHSCTI